MLAEKIIEYVKSEYNGGQLTQQEIAEALNVDQQTINRLLSGKRKPEGLTIGTFDKMFPRAEIKLTGSSINAPTINKLFPKATLQLEGDAAVISAPRNSGNVIGINNGTMESDCLSGVMNKILSTDELTAEEKVKVLKVLQK